MSESFADLTNAEIDLRVAVLLSELEDLREELRRAEEDIENRDESQIISTYVRSMINRAEAKLSELVRVRNQRQN